MRPSSSGGVSLEWVELGVALVLILFSAELFTTALEWTVGGFGLSEGPADEVSEREVEGEELGPLRLRRLMARVVRGGSEWPLNPPSWASVTQAAVGVAGIIGGARVFVAGIDRVARTFRVPELVLALLLAPIATELPEKFNSVLWVRRRKDTLALGNLTGAMVFQSSFPVTVGLLLTPWRFTGPGNVDELLAAIVALAAGTVLWITLLVRGRLEARLLLV